MRSILEQLESDEAAILMYLANELSPTDRAAIEARFAADENLRIEVDKLRAMHESIGSSLAKLDASQPISTKTDATQRRIFRGVRQWQTNRLLEEPNEKIVRARGKSYRWLYPAAAAAVLIVGSILWWGLTPNQQVAPIQMVYRGNETDFRTAQEYIPIDRQDFTLAQADWELDTAANLRTLTQ